MFGRMMNESLARLHFWFTFVGTYCIFMPMHYAGMAGQPRRYSQFTELHYLEKLIPLNTFITFAAFVTISSQLIFIFNLFWTMKAAKKASANPLKPTTLQRPPPTPPHHAHSPHHPPHHST